jgi:hypothetical protein
MLLRGKKERVGRVWFTAAQGGARDRVSVGCRR